MKQKGRIILTSVLTALSVLITLGLCAVRVGFVFVDHLVFDGFCYILWALFIVNTIVLFFQLRGSILDNKLYNKIVLIINIVLEVVNIACIAAFLIIGNDDLVDYLYVSFETLPYLAAFYALLFFTLILPISHKLLHKITACVVAAAIVISAVAFLFPAGGFDFEAAPAVFDTGDGYHIVFATNRDSVGYVKLGNEILWDTYAGRKESSRIHSIEVSYEALDNNEYSIGAARAIEDIAYGGHLGKEITLNAGVFTPCPEDDFDMTCITDNHSCRPDWEAIGADADIYVFLGDISSGVYAINSIIDNLIAPAGKVSGGVKPVIYTLGNHDHRGSYVQALLDSLDFGDYYYRLNVGKYNFTVLDSGEDKEDENYEYAGYNAFAPYFAQQIEWAKTLQKESGYNVIITHSPSIYFEPDGQPTPMAEIMRNLGEEFVICGHHHSAEYVSVENSITGIATYICGAKADSHEIVYTRMHFNGGIIDIKSQNTKGEIINTHQFQLTLAE
ncbi:MAG: metallophosphoesterase [Eubacterium sp.]|nr:metallophosphoesterase [Eubacterium sp.]